MPILPLIRYSVYILECFDGSYYCGVTNDLNRRLHEHQEGLEPTCYTYKRRPVKLRFHYEFKDIRDAIQFEKQIKGWRREKKEALMNGEWSKLPDLSMNYAEKFRKGK